MESIVYNTIGTIGVFLILTSYFMLQTGRIRVDSFWYSFVNFVGSSSILFSLLFDFNLSAAMIEIFWAIISLYGLWRFFARRRAARVKAAQPV